MVVVFGGFVAAGFPVLVPSRRSRAPWCRCSASPSCSTSTPPSSTWSPCWPRPVHRLRPARRLARAGRAAGHAAQRPVTELTHEQVVEATAARSPSRSHRRVSALTVAIALGGLGAADPLHPGGQRGRGLGRARRARRRAHPHPRDVRPRRPPAATPWHRERQRHRRLLAPPEVVHQMPSFIVAVVAGLLSCSPCRAADGADLLRPQAAAQGHPRSAPSTRTPRRLPPARRAEVLLVATAPANRSSRGRGPLPTAPACSRSTGRPPEQRRQHDRLPDRRQRHRRGVACSGRLAAHRARALRRPGRGAGVRHRRLRRPWPSGAVGHRPGRGRHAGAAVPDDRLGRHPGQGAGDEHALAGAALGVHIWIFEDGHLENLLRFTSAGAVENTIPLLVLAFGFGLSMARVFLLSRIVELPSRARHPRDRDAGPPALGRIITSPPC